MNKNKLIPPLAGIVAVVWAASFVAGVVTNDYAPLGITTSVMLVITGAVFAVRNGGGK